MNTLEQRAFDFAHNTRKHGKARLVVEWRRSREWGLNPAVMYGRDKIGFASGCGYCKESAALSAALQYLGKTEEEQDKIRSCAGTGVSHLTKVLAEMNIKLSGLYYGKTEHAYMVFPND